MAAVYFLPITRPMERRACAVILLASGQILLKGRIAGGASPQKTLPHRVRIPTYYTLLWTHLSPHPNDVSIGASVLAQLVVISNRHTDRQTDRERERPRNIGNNRQQLCTVCLRCGLINVITCIVIARTGCCSSLSTVFANTSPNMAHVNHPPSAASASKKIVNSNTHIRNCTATSATVVP